MSQQASPSPSSPPWINCEDVPPAHCSLGSVSCACVRFDRHYEALWTLDTAGYVSCLTMEEKVGPSRSEWTPHSRFRPVKGSIGISFAGNRNRPLTTVMSHSSLHVHKAGGVSVFSASIEPQQQRKVQSFLSLENSAIFAGETPVIGVSRFDDPSNKAAKYYPLDSNAVTGYNGAPISNNVNLQMCLPKALEEENGVVQKWLPIGIANGSVVLCDHANSFGTIGSTGRIFQTRVNAVRCIDNTIVAVNSLGNTTTVKIFDARKITECALTIGSIEGTLVDLDLFRNSYTGNMEILMVTPQMFYVLSTTEPAPIYRSFQIDNQSITSCSATMNGKGSVIALTSGHFLTMRRVNNGAPAPASSTRAQTPSSSPNLSGASPSATSSPATGRLSFSNVSSDPAVAIFPPRPVARPKWNIKTDMSAGFDHTKAPSTLFSAWPPPDSYMLLKVAEKHKAPAAFIRQVLESKESTLPPDCEQLVSGRRIYAFPNNVPRLQRSDLYRADQKDKISRIIPNPYPFNCEVGDDPCQVAALVEPKLKELKAKRTGRDSRYFCSEAEEALQVCYPLQGTFDWKSWNALPKDIIGVDNTLPESWISPILQCLYLVHGPHFPIRHAIVRHFCQRIDCVACEINIVFTNMITASNCDGCLPIVQLGPLLSVLRRRKEFAESRIFTPARNRDEMVGKLHMAQSLLLQCLDVDFSSVVGASTASSSASPSAITSPNTSTAVAIATGNNSDTAGFSNTLNANRNKAQFPDLPEPPEMARIIKEYFGTQLEASTPIDPILYWEMPPSAAKVEEGLTHVLKQVEYCRPQERIHIRALPPILVILLNPDHGHLQPPPTLTFTRDKEEYSYTLCCQVHHLSDDLDDKGLFVSTHSWPKASARPDTAQTTTNGNRNDTVLINDYIVTQPMTGKQFESCIPPSSSHSVALGYYSYDRFTQKSFTYPKNYAVSPTGNGVISSPTIPTQLPFKDGRRHLLNTWSFLGPLLVHDTISEAIPQPCAQKYPPQRFIRSLDDVQPSDLVAIDAEYVIPMWGNEVDQQMQRRPYYLLARVSCIVSSRAGDERVLIDDYIATDEEIKDYVSQYSGIHKDDLNPALSRYPLTTRKANNMKLRALLDRGCKFVGHGLAQDFRVCNLQVPANQAIDTVELFAKTKAAGGRKFALRLLASTLLGESIQEDEHDSVEDARTALRLYRKYCELQASGQLEAFVDTVVLGGAVDTPPRTATSPATLPRACGLPLSAATTPAIKSESSSFPSSSQNTAAVLGERSGTTAFIDAPEIASPSSRVSSAPTSSTLNANSNVSPPPSATLSSASSPPLPSVPAVTSSLNGTTPPTAASTPQAKVNSADAAAPSAFGKAAIVATNNATPPVNTTSPSSLSGFGSHHQASSAAAIARPSAFGKLTPSSLPPATSASSISAVSPSSFPEGTNDNNSNKPAVSGFPSKPATPPLEPTTLQN